MTTPDRTEIPPPGCSMMRAANLLEREMIEALDEWRRQA